MPIGQRKQHELRVAVEKANGREQAEDAAKASVKRGWICDERRSQGATDRIESQRRGGCAEHRNRVETHDPVGVVKALEKSGEEPERKKLKQRAKDAQMDEL